MKKIQSCYWPNLLALERIIRQVARAASLTVVISMIFFMTQETSRWNSGSSRLFIPYCKNKSNHETRAFAAHVPLLIKKVSMLYRVSNKGDVRSYFLFLSNIA